VLGKHNLGIPQFSVLLSLNEHLPLGTDDGGCKRQVNDLYPALCT
jgi:hypothetical protein